MNQSWQSQKPKNWQWRIIIWTSLFLIFGKGLALWIYHGLGIDQAYTATVSMANKVGITSEMLGVNNEVSAAVSELIIEVKNDTPSEYSIDNKPLTGELNFTGQTFAIGETKRFTVKPLSNTNSKLAGGDILFLSAPIAGSHNTTCQEIHTLSYDLKYANQIKQPLIVNLSSIASRMECRDNASKLAN